MLFTLFRGSGAIFNPLLFIVPVLILSIFFDFWMALFICLGIALLGFLYVICPTYTITITFKSKKKKDR